MDYLIVEFRRCCLAYSRAVPPASHFYTNHNSDDRLVTYRGRPVVKYFKTLLPRITMGFLCFYVYTDFTPRYHPTTSCDSY